jgi:hypothetical protein
MKELPHTPPKVWVNVNHTNKSIKFFLNEGGPLSGEGTFMSLEYFQTYKEEMLLHDYTYKNYPSTI